MNLRWTRMPAALAVVLTLAAVANAQGPLARKEVDTRIDSALYDVTAIAVKTFNSGNGEGAYRLFQGALQVTLPFLDHRPELKKRAEDTLGRAMKLPSSTERAILLRETVDEIREAIRKSKASAAVVTPPKSKTLWERLGGESGVRAMVKDIMKAEAADPKVNFTRGGKLKPTPEGRAKLEQKLVEFLSAGTGGPIKYTGKDMKTAHAGMGITNAEYDALAAIMVKVMKDHKVAAADLAEVAKIVESLRKDVVEK
jgi:hemoglobin